jgi:hypothetical protein
MLSNLKYMITIKHYRKYLLKLDLLEYTIVLCRQEFYAVYYASLYSFDY